jgi:hypothetical protein
MSNDITDRTLQIISDHHAQISAFARASHESDGRGCVQVEFPNVPLGTTVVGTTMMKYITLNELRNAVKPAKGKDAEVLVGMVETYDPSIQAVVMASIERENPISLKLRLQPPTLVDPATDAVH